MGAAHLSSIEEQHDLLKEGAEIVIGQPGDGHTHPLSHTHTHTHMCTHTGRIAELVERGYLALGRTNVVVLDEMEVLLAGAADGQVRSILDAMPASRPAEGSKDVPRQTIMLAASMPDHVER